MLYRKEVEEKYSPRFLLAILLFKRFQEKNCKKITLLFLLQMC